jgi:hypothetical protein
MLRRIVVLLTLGAAVALGAAPALADPSVCVTTDVTIAGTALPTNGTTCLP